MFSSWFRLRTSTADDLFCSERTCSSDPQQKHKTGIIIRIVDRRSGFMVSTSDLTDSQNSSWLDISGMLSLILRRWFKLTGRCGLWKFHSCIRLISCLSALSGSDFFIRSAIASFSWKESWIRDVYVEALRKLNRYIFSFTGFQTV